MAIKQQLDADIKAALLSGDKVLATTLRGIKSAILYAEVEQGARESGLDDQVIITILAKEAKKRQESADLYKQGNNQEKAAAELAEKAIIEKFLPEQLSDDELKGAIDQAIKELGELTPQTMGQVIGKVKQNTQGKVDGSRIAQAVKEKLQ